MAQRRRAISARESALHPDGDELRLKMVVLGVPLGAGAAHVVQLRPVGIEQAAQELVDDIAKAGKHAWCPAAGSPCCAAHDPLRTMVSTACDPVRCSPLTRGDELMCPPS